MTSQGAQISKTSILVVDGRPSVLEEVRQADATVRNDLAQEFAKLLDTEDFIDAIPAHILPDDYNQARVPIIEDRIRVLAGRGETHKNEP